MLRPIVLLPASIVTGLSTDEFSAIISHEFAHIRRYDLWMNLLQRLIESLLFFHPVVWLISNRLSVEREICCDDLVVRSGHEAMNYAGALLRMAELCAMPRRQDIAALTASGGSYSQLEHRISRLIWLRPASKFQLTRLGLLSVLFGFVALCAIPAIAMLQIAGAPEARGTATMPLAASSQPANVDEKKANADGVDEAKQTVPGSADSETSERTEPISISGTVLDQYGDPLQGAHVYVVSSASGAFLKLGDTISDAEGHYHFKDVALPIITEKRYQPPRDVFGAFEVFATDESLGFTWRKTKPFYPDSPPFNAIGMDDKAASPQRNSGHTVLDSPSGFFRDDQIKMDLAFNAPKGVRLRVVDDEGTPLKNARVRLWNADPIPGVAREFIGGNMVMNGMGFQTLYDPRLMPDGLVKRTTDADGWFEYAAMPGDCEFRIQVAPEGFAERMIFVTTGENYTSTYEVLYTDGQELIFPRIQIVKVTVTFADTLKPAPNVWVHGGSWGSGSSHGSTNDVGQITLKLPLGDCKFQVLPEYRTPYVFVDDDSLQMTVERDKENVFQIPLQRAAEIEVLAVDSRNGKPIAGADLWTILPDQQRKKSHEWRSFEQPNVVHQGPKLTGSNGKIETFFRPGTHSIGLCEDYTPVGYQPMRLEDAVTIECKAGEKQTVTLKLKKSGDESGLLEKGAPLKGEFSANAEIHYPHCLVEVDNLEPHSLAESIEVFNRTSTESPFGHSKPPITEQEMRDAITKFVQQPLVPEAVKERLREILKTGMLPSNVYFRRFTRFDDGEKMNDVWWVRLVLATKGGPVYSVPVRTTSIDSRPYTQMERQQNAAGGMTLLNRVSSYRQFTEYFPPRIPAMKEAAIDRLIEQVKEALKAKDLETLKSLCQWTNASDSVRRFAASELQTLVDSTDHSVWITPPESNRRLITWSAWQQYKPNLPIVGYLKISYTPAGEKPDIRKRLTLELGQVGDELRPVNYVSDGDRESPKSLDPGPSIASHMEPLADGTYLLTDIITNPGTLLSAHLANEEVRLRDFNRKKVGAEAVTDGQVNDTDDKAESKVKTQ